jgi:fructokinase
VTVIEPASTVLFDWAQKVANFAPIVFDPNVRPAVLNNRVKYLEQVEKWVKISTLVKLSDDDIAWLFPGEDIAEVIKKWLSMGPKLIVVTFGDKGIIGYNKHKKIRVDAEKTVVVDTVGAGDTVGAILVEGLVEFGIECLINEKLHSVLNRAAKAAAITVSRIGAHPPNRFEI